MGVEMDGITVTNSENQDILHFGTATKQTIDSGSSDFSIAKVTVSVDGDTPIYAYSIIPEDNCMAAIYAIYEGMTAEVPIYGDAGLWYYKPESFNCVGTGDVTIPEDDNVIAIFGDCTLTFTTKGGTEK